MTTAPAHRLRYRLPTTLITLSAAVRLAVVADPRGGHLEPEVAVSLASRGQPEPLASARVVPLPAGASQPSWRGEGMLPGEPRLRYAPRWMFRP